MAEHVYSGDDPEELLKKGGRGDASDISEILKECRARGSTQASAIVFTTELTTYL
jgi:hypothetical protein